MDPGEYEPEITSRIPSPSRSANCGPNPTHQAEGIVPSCSPVLNHVKPSSFGSFVVPVFL